MSKTTLSRDTENDVYTAIAHPVRRDILRRLEQGDLSVKEMTQATPLTQSAVSQHLNILLETGLVERERRGRRQIYQLRPQRLREVYEWVSQFHDSWI